MFYVIEWPHADCTLFSKGDFVVYCRQADLRFWHPIKQQWMTTSRPNILEEARSVVGTTDLQKIRDRFKLEVADVRP